MVTRMWHRLGHLVDQGNSTMSAGFTNQQLRAGLESKLQPKARYTEHELSAFALGVEWVSGMQHELACWADGAGIIGANHLTKVRDELIELESDPRDPMEMADVLLALMLHAAQNGVDLQVAAREKFEIVKSRVFGEPDERGVVRHLANREREA